nr:MAG TPA: hypothetical protein [Caudoviricetes sp.]
MRRRRKSTYIFLAYIKTPPRHLKLVRGTGYSISQRVNLFVNKFSLSQCVPIFIDKLY